MTTWKVSPSPNSERLQNLTLKLSCSLLNGLYAHLLKLEYQKVLSGHVYTRQYVVIAMS